MAAPVETAPAELSRWEPGPRRPSLAHGDVHVWRADLRSVDDAILRSLSAGERERAARILNARKARLWARSRGVLRELLGRYLQTDPSKIRLNIDAAGKPSVASMQPCRLSFNLSHSGDVALYAFAAGSRVGVDVQARPEREFNEAAIAARVFDASEGRRLAALEPARATLEFLRAWTRWEAEQKCRTQSIWQGDARPRDVTSSRGLGPWLTGLDLGARAVGALAAEKQPQKLCYWVV
jgi:4'-phosphopantetheinyl transferase